MQKTGRSIPSSQAQRPERKGSLAFSWKLYIAILILTVLLNGLSWCSTVFCDIYVKYIFPIWVNTYGRFTGLFPFSVGELLICAGLGLVVLVMISCALRLIMVIRHRRKYSVFFRKTMIFFAWILLIVGLIMTLNCFLLYHTSSFSDKYLGSGQIGGNPAGSSPGGSLDSERVKENADENVGKNTEENAAHSLSEENITDITKFLRLRNKVAARCNALSAQVERDEKGYIAYTGSRSESGERIDMQDKAREDMRRLGEQYPQLAGYYPRPKALLSSDLMCQQYMLGWYFPFSMEANYNDVAYVMNLPATMCHELAHLKGFIYEDEANFIGYLACIQSDDVYFQYSGYLSVLGYLERDLNQLRKQAPADYAQAVEQEGLVALLDIVHQDDIFVTNEEWDRIEAKALFRTEDISKAADTFVDTTLKVNGVTDGKVSYSHVVQLMLEYEAIENKSLEACTIEFGK